MCNKAHAAGRGDVVIEHVRAMTGAWTPEVARDTYGDSGTPRVTVRAAKPWRS